MRWIGMILISLYAVPVCACSPRRGNDSYGSESDGTTGTDDPEDPIELPPVQLNCDGICVETAPASYTGPSLFSIHPGNANGECPAETPFQGLEAFVPVPMPMIARECLVSPSDLCGDEGLTCIPSPKDDFQVCIHHVDESPCNGAYPLKSTMFELESMMKVTLCCQPPPPQHEGIASFASRGAGPGISLQCVELERYRAGRQHVSRQYQTFASLFRYFLQTTRSGDMSIHLSAFVSRV